MMKTAERDAVVVEAAQAAGKAGAGSTAQNPPCVSRGSKWQRGIHWLRGSVDMEHMGEFRKLLTYLWKSDGATIPLWGYEKAELLLGGGRILWDEAVERIAAHRGRVACELPGSVLEALPGNTIWWLCRKLTALGFKAVRVDVAADDHERSVEPDYVYGQCREGRVVGYRVLGWQERGKLQDGSVEALGAMATMGRRGSNGSGRFVRVYDKALESGGENGSVRWEVEFTGLAAGAAFEEIAASTEGAGFEAVLAGLVVGAVDFREAATGSDRHLDRRERCGWWQKLVEGIQAVVVSLPRRVKPRLVDVAEWMRVQLGPVIAAVRDGFSGEGEFRMWLLGVIAEGRDRRGVRHKRMIAEYQASQVGL